MLLTKIKNWGNSQGLRIPKSILKQIDVKNIAEDDVMLTVDGEKLIIEKAPKKSKLMQRFSNFDYEKYLKENKSDRVVDKGKPVGRELW
ncbi:AbrB/MazE/SpoVT family DNA-binding domain-containing protein [Pediococcus ethanolidurans]|uniref:AbrB/MazE/SpoVT family DNA-binding domain-containing protein n=1 Tax=Pediococcus ethanolidurans TaxID=319653 RepID=UPI001C1EB324|nr:AbrB/MazE/SpoVT family DNA-binding domain-containing protein [Pediococcus ethanolidurans]MBU7554218.1 AbrB/MazE/SpoVT family DNA-binding domain-containing protein [Pediococcus ethanolidurans]MCT4398964.1 AbrB/MazE/SpoVT family DNA-binding domain-containing protein [Pediococcus ethanolidurans]MCV3321291.1 AbrB/MazE/SpoVT family DNA-binding domain-containing protein [Pediococcus ethanolidurans]MCV3324182.1 AbrB/MazE/SpoVT family DNA-binding domain-containing protein [Pediococcus ethanolidurans